tara:strand:+ start:804 stop:1907 length:1104 start_codon:yes stop_codon:yes gene_type:complete
MMAIKKMYKKGGTTSKKMGKGRKKQMGGVQSPRPAASFIEPPMEQPFEQDSFVAQTGGLRYKQWKERRDKRKADRKADREARRSLRKTSKLRRQDKIDDSGQDISMTRKEKRADRAATRKATRTFRRQERKARWATNKADKAEDKAERDALKAAEKKKKQEAVNKKLEVLNQSDSSSVKTKPVEKKDDQEGKAEPVKSIKKETPVVKKKEEKTTNHGVTDSMSFSQAFRKARNSHGGKGGVFTWKGKKYNTNIKEETKKNTIKKKDDKNNNKKENKNKGKCSAGVEGCPGIPSKQHAEHMNASEKEKNKLNINPTLPSLNKSVNKNKSNNKKKKSIHQQSVEKGGGAYNYKYGKMKRGGYRRRGGRR